MMRRAATLVLLLAVLVPVAGRAAEDPRAAAQHAYELASDLMSPFCPGRTLQDCPSPDAGAVREQIRAWVEQGMSDAEIRARLEASFGDVVVAIPPSPWAWAVPTAILVLGLALLGLALRHALRAPGPAEEPVDPEIEAALLEQLSRKADPSD